MVAKRQHQPFYAKQVKMPGIGSGNHPNTIKSATANITKTRGDRNHHRRCTGKWKGERCHWWALRGGELCGFHLRSQQRALRLQTPLTALESHLMDAASGTRNFYTRRLGPKLQAALAQALQAPDTERMSILSELDLMREIAGDAVELYSVAREMPENLRNKTDLVLSAGAVAASALREVVYVAEKAQAMENARQDKYDVHALNDIVLQLTTFVAECFGSNIDGMLAFDALITTKLRLPQIGVAGTTITPDQDVLDMDATIPRYIEPFEPPPTDEDDYTITMVRESLQWAAAVADTISQARVS